jgi:hypothetical protein
LRNRFIDRPNAKSRIDADRTARRRRARWTRVDVVVERVDEGEDVSASAAKCGNEGRRKTTTIRRTGDAAAGDDVRAGDVVEGRRRRGRVVGRRRGR